MAGGRFPGPLGSIPTEPIDAGTLCRSASPTQNPLGTAPTRSEIAAAQARELRELGLDLLQMALDLSGIFDPTPISDGMSGLLAFSRGQWLDAVISGVSMVPYVGDLAKAGKFPRYLKTVENAIRLASKSADTALALVPGLRKLEQVLDLLPKGANKTLDELHAKLKHFLKEHAARISKELLPDISHTFKFPAMTTVARNGKKFRVKEASGRLGVPGKVKSHREASEKLQTKVSSGSGDDAGHLIGDQFGAPPGSANLSRADAPVAAENLSRQNWIQNQGGGTFHGLEEAWAKKLHGGTGIEVRVRDYFPEGSNRPSFRTVEWTEIAPDGSRATKQLDFMNTHTPDAPHRQGSRTKTDQKSTVAEPQENSVIDGSKKPQAQHWFNRPPNGSGH